MNLGKAEPRKNTTSPMFAHIMPVYYMYVRAEEAHSCKNIGPANTGPQGPTPTPMRATVY